MNKGDFLSNLTTVLAVIVLILICITSVLTFQDRGLQAEINARQQFINESVQLTSVNQALIRALAATSVKNPATRQILEKSGLKVTYRQDNSQAPAAPAVRP